MSYRNYRVEVFIPAGRKRQMSILMDNLSRFQNIVDKVQVWFNTDKDQVEDSAWLKSSPNIYGDWVDLRYLEEKYYKIEPKQMRTGLFYYKNTVRKDTIYVRCDDDLCYIDDDYFINMLDFRIDNPDYFLIMGLIWNNSMISYIEQMELKTIPDIYGPVEAFCMDPISWGSGVYAAMIHKILIKHIEGGTTEELFFDRADLHDAARFSISNFCFFGKDFAEFDGLIGQRSFGEIRFDEEIALTEVMPITGNRLNTICGSALVAHYSFMRQRPYLDKTDILETYRSIGRGKLSESYYDLLEGTHDEKMARRKMYKKITLPEVRQVTNYNASFSAEKAGYEVVRETDRVNIVYKGEVKKTILGKDISPADIDRALVACWNMHKAKDENK
jgi:hypothetical protein